VRQEKMPLTRRLGKRTSLQAVKINNQIHKYVVR
jgi:hypothetical protein